ncbi:unnamed protein product, partial [Polarella glacialis]
MSDSSAQSHALWAGNERTWERRQEEFAQVSALRFSSQAEKDRDREERECRYLPVVVPQPNLPAVVPQPKFVFHERGDQWHLTEEGLESITSTWKKKVNSDDIFFQEFWKQVAERKCLPTNAPEEVVAEFKVMKAERAAAEKTSAENRYVSMQREAAQDKARVQNSAEIVDAFVRGKCDEGKALLREADKETTHCALIDLIGSGTDASNVKAALDFATAQSPHVLNCNDAGRSYYSQMLPILHSAARTGRLDLLDIVLGYPNADVNIQYAGDGSYDGILVRGSTCLHMMARLPDSLQSALLIRKLLAQPKIDTELRIKDKWNSFVNPGYSALELALLSCTATSDAGVVKALIDSGKFDINSHWQTHRLGGIDSHLQTPSRRSEGSPLLLAVRSENPKAVNLVLGAIGIEFNGLGNREAVTLAASKGPGIANLVANAVAAIRDLDAAIAEGSSPAVDHLLQKGVNPSSRLRSGHPALVVAVREKRLQIALSLLRAGADVNLSLRDDCTPLSVCTDRALAEALLDNGA